MSSEDQAASSPRSALTLGAIGLTALAAFVALMSLGVWQIERRAWKLDLIERVDQRVHAAPVAAPGPAEWPGITPQSDEYRRVTVTGSFANDRETLVQASTELGPGFWVLTPLRSSRGFEILINRGYVPADRRDPATRAAGRPSGQVTVTGLLRMTEPGGGFLRSNDPAADRWYSRDVAAIAARRGLEQAAPYFVDADATGNPGGWPVGGLTVIAFNNNHLVYAVTWFGLALMVAFGAWRVFLNERRIRRRGTVHKPGY